MKTLTFEVQLEVEDDAIPTNVAYDIEEALKAYPIHMMLHVHRVHPTGKDPVPQDYKRGLPPNKLHRR